MLRYHSSSGQDFAQMPIRKFAMYVVEFNRIHRSQLEREAKLAGFKFGNG